MTEAKCSFFAPKRLLRLGVYLQMAGVVILSISVFYNLPTVMLTLLPAGAGLVTVGWLAWLFVFLREI